MWRATRSFLHRDPLNGGSSMTLGSKGMRLSPDAHRRRMPWTASREYVPGVVLCARDKVIMDGVPLVERAHIERSSQLDPLEVLKSAVAQHAYNTSTGSNIFQLARQAPFDGRGQVFFRKEWKEGTYDKHITLSAIEFDRDGGGGTAYGYVTFHGESTTRPVRVEHAEIPGWYMAYDASRAVPFDEVVAPPESVGTDSPVDTRKYRLSAYPYYDAPNPAEFVERLLKDRGVLPDVPVGTEGDGNADVPTDVEDGSEPHVSTPAARQR